MNNSRRAIRKMSRKKRLAGRKKLCISFVYDVYNIANFASSAIKIENRCRETRIITVFGRTLFSSSAPLSYPVLLFLLPQTKTKIQYIFFLFVTDHNFVRFFFCFFVRSDSNNSNATFGVKLIAAATTTTKMTTL